MHSHCFPAAKSNRGYANGTVSILAAVFNP